VNFKKDLGRFEQLDDLDDGVQVYTQVVFSKQLRRTIKVVMLRSVQGDKDSRVLLYSTDSSLDAMRLIQYYKARFQIEFLFRDAKQHTGLTHCQSRRKEAIHTHLNASLVALNLLKLEDQQIKKATGATVISIASWKRKKFNQHLMERLFQELGLSLKSQKVAQVYDQMSDYGAIAA
jgi:IS4 transposase